MARKKVGAHLFSRQEYLYQGPVYERGLNPETGKPMFDVGPPAGPVRTRQASPEDLVRFGVKVAPAE